MAGRPTIIATEPRLAATGIAIIGAVPTLIAPDGRLGRADKRPVPCPTSGSCRSASRQPVPGKELSQTIKGQLPLPATGFLIGENRAQLAVREVRELYGERERPLTLAA